MSDPFDALRDAASEVSAPDVGAIKTRARRIERRRRVALSSGAAVIAGVALIGIFVRTGPTGRNQSQLSEQASGTGGSASTSSSPFGVQQTAAPSNNVTAGGTKGQSGPAVGGAQLSGGAKALYVAPSDGLAATVTVTDPTGPHSVRFTLTVCNPQSHTVERSFKSGQRYDFDVSRNGTLVWQWSDGRAFAQMVGSERWGAKACKTWSENWNGTDRSGKLVMTGTYQAVGVLTSDPSQRTASQSFCLDLC